MPVTFSKAGPNVTVAAYTGVTTANSASQTVTAAPAGAVRATVVVTGTFGAGNTTIHGSNDGTTFAVMKDAAGAALTISAAGAHSIPTGFLYYRPVVAGGTGDSMAITFAFVKNAASNRR